MKLVLFLIGCCCALPLLAAEPEVILEDSFQDGVSPEWFWGLGTWAAKGGVFRGFESGPRRHGPVKMRKLTFTDGSVECDFRLERGATFAGIIFNGSQERGHIFHLVIGRDHVRMLAHPKKGENVELLKEAHTLEPEVWHHVVLVFSGKDARATIDDFEVSASADCIAEEKLTFGLGGDSGGPEGEKAGALEFRKLRITAP